MKVRVLRRVNVLFFLLIASIWLAGLAYFGIIGFIIPHQQNPVIPTNLELLEKWCSSPGLIGTQMVISQDVVYIRYVDTVEAIDTQDGHSIWKEEIGDDTWRVPPTLFDGSIILVSRGKGQIIRKDVLTGQVLWAANDALAQAGETTAIAIGQNNFYITRHNYGIHAYSLDTGQGLWTDNIGHDRNSIVAAADEQDIVYVGENTVLTARDANSKVLWITNGTGIVRGLTLHDGVLYFFQDSVLRAVSSVDGSTIWELPFDGQFPMRFYEGILYASGKGYSAAIDSASGRTIWVARIPTAEMLQTPTVFGEYVFVEALDAGEIYVLDKTSGKQIGVIEVTAQITEPNLDYGLSPISDNDVLLIPSGKALCAYTQQSK